MKHTLISPEEFEVGMIVTGIETTSGKVVKLRRFEITEIGFAGIAGMYLHNRKPCSHVPDCATRYEIQGEFTPRVIDWKTGELIAGGFAK